MIDMAELDPPVMGASIATIVFFIGVVMFIIFGIYIQSDITTKHTEFCDSKYGAGNWTDVVDQCSMACSYKCVPITYTKGD